MQILELGPNLFQFKFLSEFEMERILRGGPWSFDNPLLILQRWKKGMTVGNIKMEIECVALGSNMGSAVRYDFSPGC